jgi:predicted membrane channel-forming protein YqfA (hemolysin III family)
MNENAIPIFKTLQERRNTRDGQIVVWGSIVQLPVALYIFAIAWHRFPEDGTDQLLMAGFFHLAIPVALAGTFIKYGAVLDFRPSAVLTCLLAMIACLPFFISLPHML